MFFDIIDLRHFCVGQHSHVMYYALLISNLHDFGDLYRCRGFLLTNSCEEILCVNRQWNETAGTFILLRCQFKLNENVFAELRKYKFCDWTAFLCLRQPQPNNLKNTGHVRIETQTNMKIYTLVLKDRCISGANFWNDLLTAQLNPKIFRF